MDKKAAKTPNTKNEDTTSAPTITNAKNAPQKKIPQMPHLPKTAFDTNVATITTLIMHLRPTY